MATLVPDPAGLSLWTQWYNPYCMLMSNFKGNKTQFQTSKGMCLFLYIIVWMLFIWNETRCWIHLFVFGSFFGTSWFEQLSVCQRSRGEVTRERKIQYRRFCWQGLTPGLRGTWCGSKGNSPLEHWATFWVHTSTQSATDSIHPTHSSSFQSAEDQKKQSQLF